MDDYYVIEDVRPVVLVASEGPKGDPGAPGPAGPAGPAANVTSISHVHHQTTPEAVWVITHALGFMPNLTVVDSAGSVVEGDVEYLDLNTVRTSFSGAFSGMAYLS